MTEPPKCVKHRIPMVKCVQKSVIFGDIIPVWKCPECDYSEYRNED